ncbi:MAG: DUF4080 domain-containing protein [Planctomycetes bacterium]|nr:DUF4080 domain-containing protein [Planctomycetota bacterium]
MTDLLLATGNSKWQHCSFGLRCLLANLGELRARARLCEFEASSRPADAVESMLRAAPRLIGLGVYVWNADWSLQVVRLLRQVAPQVRIVLGGPEVSHESDRQEIVRLADCVVRGEGDLVFRDVAERLLAGGTVPAVIDAPPPHFAAMASPYDEYTDADIAQRVVYVESARGCPFTCEFCLSSLDVPVRKAELAPFLQALDRLHRRGVRHFKFVDRTFNLGIDRAVAILRFFRERLSPELFLHFELIPDRLPEPLRAEIAAFPPGVLQFEVGVQTLDPATSDRIARRQDTAALADNLTWLREHGGAHVHADLIVGLPGEDAQSFARGFDRLWGLGPQEIQVGILKRLRGTPITRHDADCGMLYAATAPYEVMLTAAVPFAAMQRLKRFARYWDIVANRGNWNTTLGLLLRGPSAFAAFQAFAEWLHATTPAMAGIALPRLAAALWHWLVDECGHEPALVGALMAADYARCARHDWPEFLRPYVTHPGRERQPASGRAFAARQQRHGGQRQQVVDHGAAGGPAAGAGTDPVAGPRGDGG